MRDVPRCVRTTSARGRLAGCYVRRAVQKFRPEAATTRQLDRRRILRHHDPGRNAATHCSVGERRAVITRGMSDNAVLRLVLAEREDSVAGSTALNAPTF